MKRLTSFLTLWSMAILLMAQGVKPLPTLHVEGKWLMDSHGNKVVLHGVMDTPNMYFNGWRWGSPWDGTNTNYNSAGATKCKNYFEKIFVSQEIGANKPSIEYFIRCFATIPDSVPKKAMMVGDSLTSDILGGKNAGITTCWVNPTHKNAPAEIVPDYEIEYFYQLPKLLETL